MKIVNNDKNGIGLEKGSFVYIILDDDGYSDCGIKLVHGDVFKPNFLCENDLVDVCKTDIGFNITGRNALDESSDYKVAILSKEELGEMIKSLQRIYEDM